MALDRLTKIDGGGISTTSDYRVGVITATKFVGPVEGSITATDATFSGNVSIAGTLTYEDVTNVDSVGIITARNGIKVSTGTATTALVVDGDARVTGILTVGTGSLTLDGPNNLVNVGTALTLGHTQGVQFHTQNLHSAGFEVNQINASGIITASSVHVADSIIHQGDTDTKIEFSTNDIRTTVANKLRIHHASNGLNYFNGNNISQATSTHTKLAGSDYVHRFRDEEGDDTLVQFFNTNVKNTVLEWNAYGNTTAAGNLIFRDLNTGKTEYARFTGTGSFNIAKDLDVDGHTNLDNVSIAGVTTFAQGISVSGSVSSGGLVINAVAPTIYLYDTDANSDFSIQVNSGLFKIMDSTNSYATRLSINSSGNVSIAKDLDVDGHTNLDNVSIAGVTTFTGRSDHSSSLQMLAGNNIVLLNDANSANCQIDCYGGAGFRLTSYNQTMFTCENGNSTKFYTNNGTSRLEITNGGDVLVNTGTLHIPDSLTHLGDTDTKIRFPSNNTISFETGGGEKLSINSAGRSFFNGQIFQSNTSTTVFPTSFGAYAYTAYPHELIIDNNATGTQGSFAGIYFNAGADSDGSKVGTARISAVETGNYKADLVFSTRNTGFTEKLRINANGNVGIATDNPGAILDVLTSMGRIKFDNSGSIGSRIDFANADGTVRSSIHNYGGSNEILALNTSSTINFNIANSTKMKLASNGKVGIGSDIPNRPLSIGAGDGTVALNGGNAGIYIGTHPTGGFQNNCAIARAGANNYHITGSSVGDLCIAGESTKDIIIGTSVNAGAMNERMRFHHDGMVEVTGTGSNLAFNVGGGYIRCVGSQPTVVAHKSSSTFCHIGVENNTNARAFLAYTNDKDFIIGRRTAYTGDHTGYSGADITIDKTNHAVVLSYNGGSRLNTTSGGVNVTGTLECDGITTSGGMTTTGGYINLQGTNTTKILLQGVDGNQIRYRNAAGTYTANITSIGNGDTFQLQNEKQSQYLNIETGGVRIGGTLTLPTSDTGISFGPGNAANDMAHIEWKGGSNAGYLRISTDDDSDAIIPAEYIEFGDYATLDKQGAFTQHVKIARDQFLVRTGGTSGASDRFKVDEGGVTHVLNSLNVAGITTSVQGLLFGANSAHYLYESASDTVSLRVTSSGPYAEFKDVSGDLQIGSASGTLRLSTGGAMRVIVANAYTEINGDLYMSGELNMTNGGNKNRFIDACMNDGESLNIRATINGDGSHEQMASFTRNGACSFHYDASSDFKFQTAPHGMNVHGDIHMGGTATATNQNRKIYWTGFDKEASSDLSDTAEIRHTTNVHGIAGSVLEIKADNDVTDGIALNASNGNGQIALNGQIRGHIQMHDYGGYLRPSYGTGDKGIYWKTDPAGGSGDFAHIQYYTDGSGEDTRLRIQIENDGNDDLRLEGHTIRAEGSFSSTNKHFRIPHVLSGLTTTTDLIHSVVEGPQADNLYRGRTTLVAGISTVNIDTTNNMTEGTFVNLNRDVQCFTTNETGWTAIKGSVKGNLLTIIAQDNTCTDTISWMVIGERWDLAMYDPYNPMTDANGKAKTEIPNDSYNKGGSYEEDYIRENKYRVGISTISRPSIENKEVE